MCESTLDSICIEEDFLLQQAQLIWKPSCLKEADDQLSLSPLSKQAYRLLNHENKGVETKG